ncbi:MAG: hypothetical protein P1U85_23400 [Verrucomicrobiales bacterium]|nr:hypothetical protein [Verrucomicrobiales bacterium]
MIHEFAVDPEALSGWQNFRYLVEKFGIADGRLISRFPSKWEKMVYQACDSCTEMEKKRIVESLKRIGPKLFSAGRNYDKNSEWLPNAISSNSEHPFRAIITTAENAGDDRLLDVDSLSEDDERWAVPRGGAVPRTADDMADAADKLLRISGEIVFVDPHFGAAARFGKPLTAMIRCACDGRVPRRFEYHLAVNSFSGSDFEGILKKHHRFLQIPVKVNLVFVRWDQIESSDTLHPRYILTEKGWLRFDHGLDEGNPGETTDVECLDVSLHAHRWNQFKPDAGEFDLVDAWIVTSEGVKEASWDGEAFVSKG